MAEKWVWLGKANDMPPSQQKWMRRFMIASGVLVAGTALVIFLALRQEADRAATAAKAAAEAAVVKARELEAMKPASWATFAADARLRLDASERGATAALNRLSRPMPRLDAYRLAQAQVALHQSLPLGNSRLQLPEALAKDTQATDIREAVDQAISLRWLAFDNMLKAADKSSVAEEAAAVDRFQRAVLHSANARALLDQAVGPAPASAPVR